MKFFTPELYVRSNSRDDAEADRADGDWEKATRAYNRYLSKHNDDMNERVSDLAWRLCLHDAELLSIQEDILQTSTPPSFIPFSVATISLRSGGSNTNLFYFLWSEVEQSTPAEGWPFSKLSKHWLYDELGVERLPPYPRLYWHRILWSDGGVTAIPFFDVVIQTYSERKPETALSRIQRRRSSPRKQPDAVK